MLLKRLLKYFLFCFGFIYLVTISIWLNLSSSVLTPWVQNQLNIRIPKQYKIDIAQVETDFSGLTIHQIKVNDVTEPGAFLDIQKAIVTISLPKLIVFQEIDYQAMLYEGIIEGQFDLFPQRFTTFDIKDLQINRNPFVRRSNLIVSNPILNGSGTFVLNSVPEGKLSLSIRELTLSGNPQYTNIPFELPNTSFTLLDGEVILQGKNVEVKVNSTGDISAQLNGSIDINPETFAKSTIDLTFNGSVKPEFESKLGFFESILVNYKNAEGNLSLKLSGIVQRPRVKKI